MARIIMVLTLTGLMLISCSRSDGGRTRTIRESIDLWSFSWAGSMLFDSVPLEDLRGVHLAGAGLVNRDVLVSGVIEMTGAEGTYLVLSDSSARMLVDTTRVTASRLAKMTSRGKTVLVHGEVKTGEKGHVYLLANAVRGG